MNSHGSRILDQFTRQAVPFSQSPSVSNQKALELIVHSADAGPEDTVLDVGCGPGLLVCAYARVVRHATGIDLTPAMLEQARNAAHDQRLANVSWQQGDVTQLPYPNAHFSIVSSRFVFHHLEQPLVVLKEMVRVCAPGGMVMVIDVQASADPAKADEFNRMEALRDPSHVRAMPLAELQQLFAAAGMPSPRVTAYELRDELENLLGRSFPNAGDADKIRALFTASIEDDRLGIPIRREDQRVLYAYPVSVLAARPA